MQPQLPSDLIDILIKTGQRLDTIEKALTNDAVPIGTEINWPATSAFLPYNYHVCDGSALDRVAYAALFAEIGTTYGTGDGSTTFNIPNRSTSIFFTAPAATSWTTFVAGSVFASGFSDYGSVFTTCAYTIDQFGWVTLRGVLKYTTIGSYTSWTIGTLPSGFRPPAETVHLVQGSGTSWTDSPFRLDITTAGVLNGIAPTGGQNWTGGYMSLEGVRFDTGAVATPTVNQDANWVIKVF